MPFPMKIQPIDSNTSEGSFRNDPVKPVVKSRLKRLFERQFPNVLKISSGDKSGVGEPQFTKDNNGGSDFEPSSVCLAKMVQSFIEESNEKQTIASKCGRNRCNCFNGNCNDSSDDELDFFGGFSDSIPLASSGDVCDNLKSVVSCASVHERNLLADTAKIIEMNKICKRKEDCRKIVNEGLLGIGYDSSICKSRWEKSSSFPAGEYEYIDVIVEGERLIIDVDFRSEFEIARSTGSYKATLQSVPSIFVGKPDRLYKIVSIVSEAAKQSLKKKGMHLPPWRKADYMRAKWDSSYTRTSTTSSATATITTATTATTPPPTSTSPTDTKSATASATGSISTTNFSGEFELIFGEKLSPETAIESDSGTPVSLPVRNTGEEEKITVVVSPWQPPAIKPKSFDKGGPKIVTGLASILKEKP